VGALVFGGGLPYLMMRQPPVFVKP